jgi:hypothetical protein
MPDYGAGAINQAPPVEVTLSSDDIAAIKALPRARDSSFWKNYSLLISVCAFLLSLVTAIISAYVSYKRDIHDQLNELNSAIRTIQELNLKHIEVTTKYSSIQGNPAEELIRNQIYIATISAADVAFRVGAHATTASIIPISQNLYGYGQYQTAKKLAEIGLTAARSAEDESSALQWLGAMKFKMQSPETIKEGNGYFEQALHLDVKYGISDPDLAAFIKAGVELNWAENLAFFDCNLALKHYAEGWKILTSAGPTADLVTLRQMASAKFNTGIGGVISCKPLPEAASAN